MRVKMSKHPHPHLLQVQKALALLFSKLVGRPGTGSFPRTIAPPDHPRYRDIVYNKCFGTNGMASLFEIGILYLALIATGSLLITLC